MNTEVKGNVQSAIDSVPMAMLQIVSAPPLVIKDGEKVVSWSRRSTEKTPVPATERYRGVAINAKAIEIPGDACSSKFQRLLQGTIYELADAKFTEYVKERMQDIEMPAALLSLDAVLAFWAEEKLRQVVDGDKITEWLKGSKTFAGLPDNTKAVWLKKVPKIAAPAYRNQWSMKEAAAVVAKLHDDDLEHPIAVFIATRCNNVLTTETAEAAL